MRWTGAILLTSDGDLCCSWCGKRVEGNAWQSSAVRGMFCDKTCRDIAHNSEGYRKEHPKQ